MPRVSLRKPYDGLTKTRARPKSQGCDALGEFQFLTCKKYSMSGGSVFGVQRHILGVETL